ncbi:hypothetical protein [Promicromonospora sp. NPDC050249]|uniref:hypothetical protein n=1 Tax=Promicromonospora sp. NPDC050249 TaxID=3154743 RepID=UPI003407DC2A
MSSLEAENGAAMSARQRSGSPGALRRRGAAAVTVPALGAIAAGDFIVSGHPFGYVVGGETGAHTPTVPAPPDQLAATGADLRGPAGAAVAAVVLGSLLVWTRARLLRPPPGDREA